MSEQSRIVVIDGLNMFLRNYIINPKISTNGNPVGGLVGTLGSLRKVIRETKATTAIVCWDGPGGSLRRREVIKEYKEGRKPIKKNYEIDGMDKQSERENQVWQQSLLMELLNNTPVLQLMLPGVEADDVISHIVNHSHYRGDQKVIVSSDKDFIQLLDDETILLRPIQKKILTRVSVREEYDITPENFALARAIAGDKSDNLVGVPRAGLKTIAKRLPFMADSVAYGHDHLEAYCQEKLGGVKFYRDVLENMQLVQDNYRVMNLNPPSISVNGKAKIDYAIENFDYSLNLTELKKISMTNGFADFDWSGLSGMLKRMVEHNKSA
jgi:5'-3' exonuclease